MDFGGTKAIEQALLTGPGSDVQSIHDGAVKDLSAK
jgi:hypothetical protein